MTLRRGGPAAPPNLSTVSGRSPGGFPPLERRQREHELNQALEAARRLQARLEMLGDRAADVAVVVSLRASLARDLEECAQPFNLILPEGLGGPRIFLAADDVDDGGRPNEWNAAALAEAAGERDDR